jgi:predicted CoA-binding protein
MTEPRTAASRREQLLAIYRDARVIAVVGASPDLDRPAGYVPAYLQSQGYRVIPVTPRHESVLGERAYRSLDDVAEPVDVVDVFRPAREAAEIARQAARIGAKVLWFQPDTHSAEGVTLGREAGLTVVTRICMGTTHGTLGLGPGPHAD